MTPIERFKHYAGRIARYNPAIHAFIHLRLEEAEAEAQAAQARFQDGKPLSAIDGWCFAVKANIAVKGLPHHAGIGAYRDVIAPEDAEVVRRLKAAGAVVLGIVNMHEGALGATTDNPFFGRTQNPRKEGYTPGGSSGGSGAAVSAGLCDVALGSDTMGSVRIPSAYCGTQGIKPGAGLVSEDGVLALSTTLDTVGPHARDVESLRAALSVMTGQALNAEPVSLNGLRIAVWGAGREGIQDAVEDGFSVAVSRIEAAGAEASVAEPPGYQYGRSRRAGLLISEVEASAIHAEKLGSDPEGFSKFFRKLMAWGVARPAEEVELAYEQVRQIEAAAGRIFEAHDFVIAPVAPQTAFSFDEPVPENQADFTAWANFAGLPAAAVYTGLSPAGMPLSLQVIGPKGSDGRVLDVAAALETLFGAPQVPLALQR
ncbi:amidase [Hyphomonas sp. WL0036]|uniref:amidase n=1 Tax=Hyphomonas sediminis TaxID=2866160 RepID=UPI001C80BD63|nr:amidase [Hyphomonas sediminis]MBY9066946.1 amidase [Hyphomonas sediminis]